MIPLFIFRRSGIEALRAIAYKMGYKPKENECFDKNFELKKSVDENLGEYFECLSGLDQKRWYA